MATETSDYASVHGNQPTPQGKVNFPEVFEPTARKGSGDTPKYSLMLVFKKDDLIKTPEFTEMIRCIDAAAKEQFSVDGYRSKYKGKALNTPFKTSEHYDFLGEDEVGIRFNSKFKPEILDHDGVTYLESDKEFYSGCLARVSYDATAYDVEGNRGVKFQLCNVQKVGAGKRWVGSRKKATDEFGAVECEPGAFGGDVDTEREDETPETSKPETSKKDDWNDDDVPF